MTPKQLTSPSGQRQHLVALQTRSQRGVSLIFALISLVTLLLATMALVRSVDTAALLLGNFGFKQDATSAGDQAARQAMSWLTTNSATLTTDVATSGYYASIQELAADGVTVQAPVDVTGQLLASTTYRQLVDWDNNSCSSTTSGTYTSCSLKSASAGAINSNSASYVIFRLCNTAGDPASVVCAKPITSSSATSSGRGELNYSASTRFSSSSGAYYRIVVRVLGARNTVSFTETIVHF